VIVTDPGDKDFYQRSPDAHLPEDRPRGGGATRPVQHRKLLGTAGVVILIIVVILLGIALFP
jgi:hypothetical protein